MKKILAVVAVAMLFGASFGVGAAAAAFNLGNIGQSIEKAATGAATDAATSVVRDPAVPTEKQVAGDADYVKLRSIYYKKSSVNVLSKDPNNTKITVTTYDFIGGRIMIADYLIECELRSEGSNGMFITMLETRTYDEKTSQKTSTLSKGGRESAVGTFETGTLARILYKEATGKEPPKF